jgi:hypothetical protein
MQTKVKIFPPLSNLSLQLWSEGAVLAMIGMELTWITAWYMLTSQTQSSLVSTILFLGLALTGSYGLGRMMSARHWRLALRRSVFVAWLIFYAFFSLEVLFSTQNEPALSRLLIHPLEGIFTNPLGGKEGWHILVICLLGLRGAALSTRVVEQRGVLASLQFGMLMVLLYGLGKSISDPLSTALVFFIFLAFGMISLSAASIAGISDLRGGRLPRLNWAWTAGILISALLAAGVSVLAGWLLSGKVVSDLLGQITVVIFTILLALIGLVLSPLLFLLYWIITYLARIMSGMIDPKVLEAFVQSLNLLNHAQQGQVDRLINTTLIRNIILGSAIAGVILITLFILKRQPRKRRLVAEENSIDSAIIRRPYDPGNIGKDRAGWINPRRLLAAAQVRRIYAQLMDLSAKLGYPRPPALTPLEFLPTLREVFPEGDTQVSLITGEYLKVRYGELPENNAEVEDVRQAWGWLKRRSEKLLMEMKRSRKKR